MLLEFLPCLHQLHLGEQWIKESVKSGQEPQLYTTTKGQKLLSIGISMSALTTQLSP